ncbi:alpha/beta-hydrolase, partial [Neoconidiobolus thromboides FSU 785]
VTKRATIKEAKRNVWYAASGLCNPNKIKNWDCRLCDTLPNTKFIQAFSDFLFEIQGYVGIDEDDKSIFIVFRGLNSISNLLDTTYLLNTQFPDAGDTKIRVHLGIYRAMDSVSKQFLEIIDSLLQQEEYKNYNIKFIGHSMGGSIASLAAARTQAVLDLDWERISLFTYGQTRVGNSNFARWYNSKPLKTARVVQFADLIPRLPPRIVLDYTHHGNEIYLDRRGPHYCSNTALEDPNC